MSKTFLLLANTIVWWLLFRPASGIIIDWQKIGQQQFDVTLNGVTVLNPPFIYSESGPYRGYCVDILKELSHMLKFQFTLRQSFDGQIGSVRTQDGVFGEIMEKNVDFAIGDISRNWLNSRMEAERNGIMFTRPIYISTIKVLLTKTLQNDLLLRKQNLCKSRQRKMADFSGISTNIGNHTEGILNNRSNNVGDKNSFSSVQPLFDQLEFAAGSIAENCSENFLTIHDIFNSPDLIRVIFKGGAVHRFYSTINIDYLNDLIIVERASLSTLLIRLQKHKYVLIDESKFVDYFVDNECEYTSIDVARTSIPFSNNQNNAIQSLEFFYNQQLQEQQQLTIIRKEELFQNEISIAFSKSFLNSYELEMDEKRSVKNWLTEFDRAIEILDNNGILQRLLQKHWLNNCRRKEFNSLNSSHLMVRFAYQFYLILMIIVAIIS